MIPRPIIRCAWLDDQAEEAMSTWAVIFSGGRLLGLERAFAGGER